MTLQTSMSSTYLSSSIKNDAAIILSELLKVDLDSTNLLTNDVVAVQIHLSSPEITIYDTTETTPIMTFIGNIGGQLGNLTQCYNFN